MAWLGQGRASRELSILDAERSTARFPTRDFDSFRQAELFHLAKINDRLDTVIVLLVFIVVATFVSAFLLILGR